MIFVRVLKTASIAMSALTIGLVATVVQDEASDFRVKLLTIIATIVTAFLLRLISVLPARSTDGAECTDHFFPARNATCAALVVLGSGGHTTEMLRLMSALNRQVYLPRTYVCADTDKMSPMKLDDFEKDSSRDEWKLVRIPRAREVRQSALGTMIGTTKALFSAFPLIFQSMPDLVLTNGPGTCIPLCVAAYIPRLLGLKRIQVVYVESICRVKSLSMTAKLLYPFCDGFVVQWEDLNQRYPATTFLGRLY